MSQRFVCIIFAPIIAVLMACVGCDDIDDGTDSAPKGGNIGIVVTTDYSSGAVSSVAVDTRAVTPTFQVVHSDTSCRYDEITGHVFLVHRYGSDAVSVLDEANGYQTMAQYSVGAGSNAQDIAVVSARKAFVPRLGSADLLIVNPLNGAHLGQIDLSAYADADGIPEAAQAVHREGKVYVTLQRLDAYWTPTEYSSVLVVDAATNAILNEVKLTGKNPTGILRYNDVVQGFVLLETGAYSTLDGGIETMATDGTLSNIIVTEQTLGGDVVDAIITAPNLGFAVISVPGDTGSQTQLVVFNPQTGAKGRTLIASAGYDLGTISLIGDNQIWVADRTSTRPGIRIFNANNGAELTTAPIDVGLPPSMICVGE